MKLQHLYEKINSDYVKDSLFDPWDDYSLSLRCFDRLGAISSFDIEAGNICILGQDDNNILHLSEQIIDCFKSYNHRLAVVDLAHNFQVYETSNLERQRYLIQVNLESISFEDIEIIIADCQTKFIFRLEGLDLASHIGDITNDDNKYNKIITSLGGDSSFRKVLIASLNQREFLAINKNTENVRSLI